MGKSKNIGDQVRDAIQDAIDSQDFSNLKDVVGYSIDTAADAVSQGLRQAAQAAQEGIAQQNVTRAFAVKQEQERIRREQELAAIKARFEGVSGKKAGGYIMAIAGGLLAFAFLILSLIFVPIAIATSSMVSMVALALPVALMAIGAGLLLSGVRRISFLQRFRAYQGVLASRQVCSVDELAAQTSRSKRSVLKDVRKMIDKGLFRQGHLDDAETQLIVTDAAYENYRIQFDQAKERERQQRLAQSASSHEQSTEAPNGEVRAILQKGESFVTQIRESNEAIEGEEISAKIDQIESVVRSIFRRAEEHPEVIPELDRLMDYYLPTTVKLLDAYEDLDRQPIQSETMVKSKAEIEATLDTLNVAFAKLLDSIFADVAWDVSTDVTVLHTVLAQEGLVEDPFIKKPGSEA